MVDCAIRAEQVRFADQRSGLDATIAAIIDTTLFEGDRLIYTVRSPELLNAQLRIIDHDQRLAGYSLQENKSELAGTGET